MRAHSQRFGAPLIAAALAACSGGQSGPRPAPSLQADATTTGGTTTTAGAATSAGAPSTSSEDGFVAADDPHLRFYGRWLRTDPKNPTANWGPIAIALRFESPTLSLELVDAGADLGAEGKGNVYQFSIDGGPFQLLGPDLPPRSELASGLAAGAHEVMLVRRTESKWGKTTFVGFHLAPGARLLPPPAASHSIEVFGDSISAGLANENTGPYTNQTENGYAAFGPTLAAKLGAEWRVEARGGGSFYNDFYLPMLPFFERTFGPENKQNAPAPDNPPWSFGAWQPEVLLVALGTNDFSEQYPHIEASAYVTKHQAFLTTLRSHYPSTEIFCLAPFKPGAPWDEARSYIGTSVATFGDSHIHAIDPTEGAAWLSYPEDYVTGDEFHPNLKGHEEIATRLEAIVKGTLGW